MRIDVLDDWAGVAKTCADWGPLFERADVVFHDRHLRGDSLTQALAGTDALIMMRERTVLDGAVLTRLPNLRAIALAGNTTRHLDMDAIRARGIDLFWSGSYHPADTAEFVFGLILAAEKEITAGAQAIRDGGFIRGSRLGRRVAGLTLGIIGLGKIGSHLAPMARAMNMNVLAWSPSLTPERAAAAGARLARFEETIAGADILSIHVTLKPETRGLIGKKELAMMKDGALLVNTARGPIVDEASLIGALKTGRIRAALDVFDQEPLPADHPLRPLPNVTLTPHIGYAIHECMDAFYQHSIENLLAWMDGKPIRLIDKQ